MIGYARLWPSAPTLTSHSAVSSKDQKRPYLALEVRSSAESVEALNGYSINLFG